MTNSNKVFKGLFAFSAIIILALASFTYYRMSRVVHFSERINNTLKIKFSLEKIISSVTNIESSTRGYIITGDPDFLKGIETEQGRIKTSLINLENLFPEKTEQYNSILQFNSIIRSRLNLLNDLKKDYQEGKQVSRLIADVQAGKEITRKANIIAEKIQNKESEILSARTERFQKYIRITPASLLILSLSSLLILSVSFIRINRSNIHNQKLLLNKRKLEKEIQHKITEIEKTNHLLDTILNSPNIGNYVGKTIRNEKNDIEDFEFLMVNKKSEELWQRVDLKGKRLLAEFPSEKKLFDNCKKAIESNSMSEFELSYEDNIHPQWVKYSCAKMNDGFVAVWNDITTAKKAEMALLKQTDLNQAIIDNTQNMLAVYDRDSRVLIFNKSCEQTLNIKKEAAIGKVFNEIFPSLKNKEFYYDLLLGLKGEMTYKKGYLSFLPGRHVEQYTIPLKDKKNNVYAVLSITHDTTEEILSAERVVRANRILKERNQFAETLLNSSVDSIVVLNKNLQYISLNKKAIQEFPLLKLTKGKSILDVPLPMDAETIYTDLQKILNGQPVQKDKTISVSHSDYYETDYIPLKRENAVYGIMIVARNITEKILNENKIHQLLQTYNLAEHTSKIGSFKWNIKSKQFSYSDNMYKLLGCEPGEFEPSAETFLQFIHPDDISAVSDCNLDLVKTPHDIERLDFKIIKKDGKIINARITGTIVEEDGSKMLIGTLQDISSQVSRENLLHEKNTELEQINNELNSFAYVSSHDLQEPLRKIQMFTQRIREKEFVLLTPDGQNYFDRIEKAAERMQKLINDLLAYSRTSASEKHFKKTDLNFILNIVKEELEEKIKSTSAVIESDDLPEIDAIQFQMKQLFINILSNSLKFTRKNIKPVIKINYEKVQEFPEKKSVKNPASKYHKITFSDNGLGFEKEFNERIFAVFQQLHPRHEYEGTGIGLSIVKKIVDIHHGIVIAEGRINEGSSILIYLPIK